MAKATRIHSSKDLGIDRIGEGEYRAEWPGGSVLIQFYDGSKGMTVDGLKAIIKDRESARENTPKKD